MRPVEIGYSGHKTITLNCIVSVPGGAVVVVWSGGAVAVGAAVVECSSGGAVAVGAAVVECSSGGAVAVGAAVVECSSGGAVAVGAAVVECSSGGAVAVGAGVGECPSGGAVVVVDFLDDETPAAVVGDFTFEEAVETLADSGVSCSPLVPVVEATGGTVDCVGAGDIVAAAGADVVPVDCVVTETTCPGGFVCVVLGTFVDVDGIFIVVVGVFVGAGAGAGVVSVSADTSTDFSIDPRFFW